MIEHPSRTSKFNYKKKKEKRQSVPSSNQMQHLLNHIFWASLKMAEHQKLVPSYVLPTILSKF